MAIVRIVILLSITLGMAMAVLWHARQTVSIGYRVTELEKKKATMEERNRVLEDEISALQSPDNILKSLDKMELELVPPGEKKRDLANLVVEQRNGGNKNKNKNAR